MRSLLLLFVAACWLGCGSGSPDRLVLISLDTVRRDHLPTYGYARLTAPRIDALSRRTVVFENAFAQQTNTNPSHASMFTGLYPHVHGSRFNGVRLARGRVTLAQILRRSGFRTAGFVSGVTMRAETSGLNRGFEVYDDAFEGKRRDGRIATTRAVEWIRARDRGERYFLFLHLYDAHGAYLPQGRYTELYQSSDPGPELPRIPRYQRLRDSEGRAVVHLNDYVDRYDAMIRYQDDLVASLLAELDLSRTVVVILSDHGETLGERFQALDHGGQVFDEQIRIPLFIYAPPVLSRRSDAYVETVDLLPTLLEILEVPIPKGLSVQGRSLVPELRGEQQIDRPVVFSSARSVSERFANRGYRLRPRSNIHSARSPRWKLILYPGETQNYVELYDLEADPAEQENRAEAAPKVRDALLRALEGWLEGAAPEVGETPLPPHLQEQLRELGYLD
jgi:arylsulfatase A-like enzyme